MKMTADSDERDRLGRGGDTGTVFLHHTVTMGQAFAVFFA